MIKGALTPKMKKSLQLCQQQCSLSFNCCKICGMCISCNSDETPTKSVIEWRQLRVKHSVSVFPWLTPTACRTDGDVNIGICILLMQCGYLCDISLKFISSHINVYLKIIYAVAVFKFCCLGMWVTCPLATYGTLTSPWHDSKSLDISVTTGKVGYNNLCWFCTKANLESCIEARVESGTIYYRPLRVLWMSIARTITNDNITRERGFCNHIE